MMVSTHGDLDDSLITCESSRNFVLVMRPSGHTDIKLPYCALISDSDRRVLLSRLDT